MGSCASDLSEEHKEENTQQELDKIIQNNTGSMQISPHVQKPKRNNQQQPESKDKPSVRRLLYSQLARHPALSILVRSNSIAISKDEYVIASTDCVYKYNANSNVWTVCVEYPKGLNAFTCHGTCSSAFDPNTQTLYIFNRESVLLTVRMDKARTLKLHKLYALRSEDAFNENVSTIFIEDTLHIIGGTHNNKHFIFKPTLQRFKQVHAFKEYPNGFSSHSAVYVRSQSKLLLFGGCADFNLLDTIYSFCLLTFKWTKLRIRLPTELRNASCILSGNEKFILIIGGEVERNGVSKPNKEIYVMDVRTFHFRKSHLNLSALCKGEMVGCTSMDNTKFHEMVICAYLRLIWLSLKRKNMRFMSVDCIRVILSYYGDGDIYILNKEGAHRKVDLDDILYASLVRILISTSLC